MISAVILMAGKGERLNLGYNKMFYEINNKPIFVHTLEKFENNQRINEIILVVNENDSSLFEKFTISKNIKIVNGGKTRSQSVRNGLNLVTNKEVLIHDGARCNISLQTINDVLDSLELNKTVLVGTKVTDTIKQTSPKFCTIPRENLLIAQTPQAGKTELLLDVYQKSETTNVSFTDDISLIEYFYPNLPIHIVEGTKNNFKVTTKEDLDLLKFYLEVT